MLENGELDAVEIELKEQQRKMADELQLSSALMAKLKDEVDSEDMDQNYDSNQWGEGTSKAVANHYKTVQNDRRLRAENTQNDWKKKAS
jgi:hypothetical protein